jgi:hypothetical protein
MNPGDHQSVVAAQAYKGPYGVGPEPVSVPRPEVSPDYLAKISTAALLEVHDVMQGEPVSRDDYRNQLLRIKAITIRSLAKIDALR